MHILLTKEVISKALGSSLRLSSHHCFPGCACHRDSGDPSLAQVGYEATQFFDGFYVLIQVMSLNEVTQMRGIFVTGQIVQVQ